MKNEQTVLRLKRKLKYLRELQLAQEQSIQKYSERRDDYPLALTQGKLEQTKADIKTAERLLAQEEKGGW